jgi:ribonuclease J
MFNLTIHRGTQEIGGSCVEIWTENTRIILDIGLPLVEKDGSDFKDGKYKNLDRSELISKGLLPDINGLYDDRADVDALLISHAHADHYGLAGYTDRSIPCYISRATKDLIELSNIFTPQDTQLGDCRFFESGKMFKVGDFRITPFIMDHSAFDSYAFLIEHDGKSVFYT